MKRYIAACASVLLLSLFAAGSARAESHEHTRSGFFIGFGFGMGNAAWDWVDPTIGDNASEGSGVGNFRLGGALRDNLILGLEFNAWSKTWDVVNTSGAKLGEFNITLSMVTLGATWFPGNMGWFLRGGLGFASAVPEIKSDGFTVDTNDGGFGLLLATGYEWRLTDKFALGPQVELAYLGMEGDVFKNPTIIDGSLQFNWYW